MGRKKLKTKAVRERKKRNLRGKWTQLAVTPGGRKRRKRASYGEKRASGPSKQHLQAAKRRKGPATVKRQRELCGNKAAAASWAQSRLRASRPSASSRELESNPPKAWKGRKGPEMVELGPSTRREAMAHARRTIAQIGVDGQQRRARAQSAACSGPEQTAGV